MKCIITYLFNHYCLIKKILLQIDKISHVVRDNSQLVKYFALVWLSPTTKPKQNALDRICCHRQQSDESLKFYRATYLYNSKNRKYFLPLLYVNI